MTLEEFLKTHKNGRAITPVTMRSKRKRFDWKAELIRKMEDAGLPIPETEYVFHAERKWRFDFSWKKHGRLVACEFEGGIWMQTETGRSKGHAHPNRFLSDCEKYNEAALYGWLVIRVTPEMVEDGRAIDWLQRALLEE